MERKRRTKSRSKGPRRSSLATDYSKFFIPAPAATDERSGGSLEQPSPFKPVRSVLTFSVGERPVVSFPDATLG